VAPNEEIVFIDSFVVVVDEILPSACSAFILDVMPVRAFLLVFTIRYSPITLEINRRLVMLEAQILVCWARPAYVCVW
jgi:hypothetical protein